MGNHQKLSGRVLGFSVVACLGGFAFGVSCHDHSTAPASRGTPQRVQGNGIVFLTRDIGTIDEVPRFGPNGENVVFSRQGQLYRVPISMPSRPQLLLGEPLDVSASRPDWSRANGRVAFAAMSWRGAAIWSTDSDLRQASPLTPTSLSSTDMYPSWTGDGTRMVFVRYLPKEGTYLRRIGDFFGIRFNSEPLYDGVLYEMEVKTGQERQLTNPKEYTAGMPSIAPDGRQIAFAGQKTGVNDGESKRYIWILKDDEFRLLDAEQSRTPDWSPDGKRIAFESARGEHSAYGIFIKNADGSGEAVRITPPDLPSFHPDWSPNGRCLTFEARPSPSQSEPRTSHVAVVVLRLGNFDEMGSIADPVLSVEDAAAMGTRGSLPQLRASTHVSENLHECSSNNEAE